jgi:hypothetical protein
MTEEHDLARTGPVTNAQLLTAVEGLGHRLSDYQTANDRRVAAVEVELWPLRGIEARLALHLEKQLQPLATLIARADAADKRQERIWSGVKLLLTVTGGTIVTVLAKWAGVL